MGCKIGQAYQILLSQLSDALNDAGLDITTSEYLILRAVYSDEGLQQCEIADMVGKDKAGVCRCVAALEKKGLVRTEQVSHKCLRVFLTERSVMMEPAIMRVATIRHEALTDMTTPAELEVFTSVIERIINSK